MSTRLLARLPPLVTTGVGSLPFADPGEAVRHVAGAYELPFCPQLPRLDGDMIAEWLGSDPGRCGWAPDRDRDRARPAAWGAFVEWLASAPPAHGVVKLQVTGPLTLAIALERAAGRRGASAHSLAVEVAHWLAANVGAQARALAELGLQTLLVIDEPGLAGAGLPEARVDIWDPLRWVAGAWGLHVCGAVPWRLVDVAAPDLLSFDLMHDPPGAEARVTLRRLVARGGRVGWGAVDPLAPGEGGDAAGRLSLAVASLSANGTFSEAAAASVVSPACGTGRLSVDGERRVAATLGAARDAVRQAASVFAVRASEVGG